MRYQEDLQVALRDRLRRLLTVGFRTYGHEMRLTVDWMRGQPAIASVLRDAENADQDVKGEDWIAACGERQGLVWPTTSEAGRARLIWAWMQTVEDDDRAVMGELGHAVTNQRNMTDMARELTELVVVPLFDYLGEQITGDSSVLYLLERYVRRVEWFDRDSLHQRYLEERQQGEQVYDRDLRRFLFDQGMNMPFSQPKSASGLSDVLSDLDTDDPLICEIKLFDADSHDKRGLVGGVHQVVQYAQDHSKAAAYLVVINLSGRPLELPSDGSSGAWPPYVDLAGVRVYLLAVRALPTVSASKLGKAKPVVLSRNDFIDPDA